MSLAAHVIGFADLLDTLVFANDEFVSIGYESRACPWSTAVMQPGDAPGHVEQLPPDADVFFSVNPTAGPARTRAGRGKENDVTRLAALVCDLDLKQGGCPSLDVANAIVAEVGVALGMRASIIVESGSGLHAYWPVDGGEVVNGDIASQRALVRRFGRLVAVVAKRHNVNKVDNVFDLPRMMRVPGTFNCKTLR